MLDVGQLLDMFTILYGALLDFGSIFNLSLREAISALNDSLPSVGSILFEIVTNNTTWEIWDYSLIVLVLGTSGALFVGISLIKWLLDILT